MEIKYFIRSLSLLEFISHESSMFKNSGRHRIPIKEERK